MQELDRLLDLLLRGSRRLGMTRVLTLGWLSNRSVERADACEDRTSEHYLVVGVRGVREEPALRRSGFAHGVEPVHPHDDSERLIHGDTQRVALVVEYLGVDYDARTTFLRDFLLRDFLLYSFTALLGRTDRVASLGIRVYVGGLASLGILLKLGVLREPVPRGPSADGHGCCELHALEDRPQHRPGLVRVVLQQRPRYLHVVVFRV